jgi:predicted flap endonuclease-1-like 5' DNA nuclease
MITLFDFCSCHPILPWLLPFLLGLGIGWLLWARYINEVDHLKNNLANVNQNLDQANMQINSLESAKALLEGQLSDIKQKIRSTEKASATILGDLPSLSHSAANPWISTDASSVENHDENEGLKSNIDSQSNSEVPVHDGTILNEAAKTHSLPTAPNNEIPIASTTVSKSQSGLVDPKNLQVLEGVGPRVQSILADHNIVSFEDLAVQTPDQLRSILDTYGTKYRMIDPEPWIEQAKIAVKGDWDGVVEAQKYIYSRKNPQSHQMPETKLEKYLIKSGYLRKYDLNDLQAIEGIGPKIATILNEAGILTWANLADTTVERLKVILEKAGPKYMLAEPTTWPQQALLAHHGDWVSFHALQEKLKGGRKRE